MLQPRIRGSAAVSRDASLTTLATAFNALTFCTKHSHLRPQLPLTFTRNASHAAQGRANGPKDSAGRRLGAKKTASEYVIPGNIIFKQRGTKWFPGENVGMGKDHTIYAVESGYVRYYKNPDLHPKRRYIGVALEREGPGSKLPTPPNAATRRRLGMYAAPMKAESDADFLNAHLSANSKGPAADSPAPQPSTSTVSASATKSSPRPAPLLSRPDAHWPSNYSIGKAMEATVGSVRPYDRKDRWLAWRKRAKKVKEGLLAKAAKANRKSKGKKTNKVVGTRGGARK